MMSKRLDLIFNNAIKKANELRHEYLILECILLAQLSDSKAINILSILNADINEMKKELEEFLNTPDNFSILTEDQINELSEKQFGNNEIRELAKKEGIIYRPELSMALQRVLQRSAIHMQASGKDEITGLNLLVSMFDEKESFAMYTLEKHGVTKMDLIEVISHGNETQEEGLKPDDGINGAETAISNEAGLEEFTSNLNELARQNKIDPLIGRKNEIERITRILCRRNRNNPLLVGESGVGKTAVAEGLAWLIEKNEVSDVLRKTEIFSLDMGSIIAGARYRGDFEQRLKKVIKMLEKKSDDGKDIILFIDEIHTVMGAGATGTGSMDASNLLKPMLSERKIRCMGSTTHEEYRKFIEKDTAFARRFQKIDIDEPNKEDTLKILLGLKTKFEEYHKVKYSNQILKMVVNLSDKYISDKKRPDKAIDVMDEAGATIKMLSGEKRTTISIKDIENAVSLIARIPKQSVKGNEKEKLINLKQNLKMFIFGQDDAIKKVSDSVILSRSGLGNDEKPFASFLFAGPTGVGKTELAIQLAKQLGIHFERFDMSEYMEKHAVAKLIGAPPGYIGHDQGGILTDVIKKHPHTVLLLDEIEKAHQDVYNVLLQVMDHGSLTDSHGRTTNFKTVILIMTTNAGAREMESGQIGIKNGNGKGNIRIDHAIKNFFSPEFRNRLDGIIHFNRLVDEIIIKIVDKFLFQLKIKLEERKVELIIDHDVKEWLAKTGYDHKMGARPLERFINQEIKKPLSREILFGKLEKGGTVHISINVDKIFFNFKNKFN